MKMFLNRGFIPLFLALYFTRNVTFINATLICLQYTFNALKLPDHVISLQYTFKLYNYPATNSNIRVNLKQPYQSQAP